MIRWERKPRVRRLRRLRRLTSRDFDDRDRERDSGYTPDLFKNPIIIPVGYYIDRSWLWIVTSDGARRTASDLEEELWADGKLKLPCIESPRPRRRPVYGR